MPRYAQRQARHGVQGSCRHRNQRERCQQHLRCKTAAAAHHHPYRYRRWRRRHIYCRRFGVSNADAQRQVPEDVHHKDRPSRTMDLICSGCARDTPRRSSYGVREQARHARRICRRRDSARHGQGCDEVDGRRTHRLRIHV